MFRDGPAGSWFHEFSSHKGPGTPSATRTAGNQSTGSPRPFLLFAREEAICIARRLKEDWYPRLVRSSAGGNLARSYNQRRTDAL